jgi:hypothetical protein
LHPPSEEKMRKLPVSFLGIHLSHMDWL